MRAAFETGRKGNSTSKLDTRAHAHIHTVGHNVIWSWPHSCSQHLFLPEEGMAKAGLRKVTSLAALAAAAVASLAFGPRTLAGAVLGTPPCGLRKHYKEV